MYRWAGLYFRIKAVSITTWSTTRVTFIIYRRTIYRCPLTDRTTEREIHIARSDTFAHVCQGTVLNNPSRIYRLKCSINSALGHGAVLLLLLVRSNPMVEAATRSRAVWANVPNVRKICTRGVEMSLFVSACVKRISSKAVFL